jgi:hypothetical protein
MIDKTVASNTGWGSSDSDTSARASRGAWSPQGFRWWFTIAIARRPKISRLLAR